MVTACCGYNKLAQRKKHQLVTNLSRTIVDHTLFGGELRGLVQRLYVKLHLQKKDQSNRWGCCHSSTTLSPYFINLRHFVEGMRFPHTHCLVSPLPILEELRKNNRFRPLSHHLKKEQQNCVAESESFFYSLTVKPNWLKKKKIKPNDDSFKLAM